MCSARVGSNPILVGIGFLQYSWEIVTNSLAKIILSSKKLVQGNDLFSQQKKYANEHHFTLALLNLSRHCLNWMRKSAAKSTIIRRFTARLAMVKKTEKDFFCRVTALRSLKCIFCPACLLV